MPPNWDAEHKHVEREIAQQPGLDGRVAHILDRVLDARLQKWNAEIQQAYRHRLGVFEDELAATNNAIEKQESAVAPKREERNRAKSNLDKAYRVLMGYDDPPAAPLAAAVTQDLSVWDGSAPHRSSVATSTIDDAKKYDGEGQLPGIGPGTGDIVHYGVLLLAGMADLVAFYQVLALVLGTIPELLYVAVVAVTVIALAVMHKGGTTLREIRRRTASGRYWVATLCILSWVALGSGAYWLRLKVRDDTGASTSLLNFGGVVLGEEDTTVQTKALVFLVIYVTTGILALIGAYLAHNPLRTEYRRARRLYHKRDSQLQQAEAVLHFAREQKALLDQRIKSEPDVRQQALDHRRALACALKAYARTEVAKRLDNPAEVEDLLSQPIPGCPDASHVSGAHYG